MFVWLIFSVMFLGMGGVVLLIGLINLNLWKKRSGSCTEKTMALVEVEKDFRNDEVLYSTIFIYQVNGKTYQRGGLVNSFKYKSGDHVEILYDPNRPEKFFVASDRFLVTVYRICLGVAIFFGVLSLIMLILYFL